MRLIPLNSRVNGFLKRIYFSLQSFHKIISHPFLKIFTAITVSTKSPPPPMEWRRKSADGCRTTFSLRPNSSESEKAWSSFNLKIFFAPASLRWSLLGRSLHYFTLQIGDKTDKVFRTPCRSPCSHSGWSLAATPTAPPVQPRHRERQSFVDFQRSTGTFCPTSHRRTVPGTVSPWSATRWWHILLLFPLQQQPGQHATGGHQIF